MKSISKENFLNEVFKCINGERKFNDKPVMVHFHSNADIDSVRKLLKNSPSVISVSPLDCDSHSKGFAFLNEKLIRMEDHPELSQQFFPPAAYRGNEDVTKCFLFFFFGVNQLQADYVTYCRILFRKIPLPIFYLVNDYSEDPLNAMQDNFFEHIDVILENEDANPICDYGVH